jgi:hypothetical protein
MKIKQDFADSMDDAILKEFKQRGYLASADNFAIFEEEVEERIMGAVFSFLRCEEQGGEVPGFYNRLKKREAPSEDTKYNADGDAYCDNGTGHVLLTEAERDAADAKVEQYNKLSERNDGENAVHLRADWKDRDGKVIYRLIDSLTGSSMGPVLEDELGEFLAQDLAHRTKEKDLAERKGRGAS